MTTSKTTLFTACALALAALGFAAGAFASGQGMRVDRDHMAVHTLDVVDARGVSRMTISGNQAGPTVDGVEHTRVAPMSGIVVRDASGGERGGYGFLGGDRNSMVLTLDHHANEAFGVRVDPDGDVTLNLYKANPPGLAQNFVPLNLNVSPDGTPQIQLQDHDNHTRLRITVTPEGYGAIEFLNAQGQVVSTFAPERDAARR